MFDLNDLTAGLCVRSRCRLSESKSQPTVLLSVFGVRHRLSGRQSRYYRTLSASRLSGRQSRYYRGAVCVQTVWQTITVLQGRCLLPDCLADNHCQTESLSMVIKCSRRSVPIALITHRASEERAGVWEKAGNSDHDRV